MARPPPSAAVFDGGALVKRRYAAAALLVLLLLAGVRMAVGVQDPPPTLVVTGHVDIGTGADGRLLLLVDGVAPHQPADGLVDHAFRLQNAPFVNYSGPATVTYVRGRVTVQVGSKSGWAFTVIGRPLPPPDDSLVPYAVSGISHMWGAAVHQAPDVVFANLSSGTCSSTTVDAGSLSAGDDPACKDCQTGGPGVQGCSMDCGGSSCSADCADYQYACCNCPTGCGCCGNGYELGSAHH